MAKIQNITRLLLTGIITFAGVAISQAQKYSTASDYMTYMDQQHQKIGEDMWSYTNAISHGKNAKNVETKRKELINTTLSVKKNIEKMPDFEGDGSLRDSMVSYLNMSSIILNEDYAKIVNMEEIAEQSYDLMEAYMAAQDKANQKMEECGLMLENQIKKFATDHKIQLVESKNKLSMKLGIANEVFKYYNQVYLVFFKSFKQEVYLIDAINKNNINAIEQNKNALLSNSEEGNKLNDQIKLYKNDPSLKASCKLLLDFYKSEATEKIPVITDYLLKKEKFEKEKAAFDNKPANTRTKDDINSYNKAVNEYNNASNQYNLVSQELSTKRNNLLNSWNNNVQAFFNRNIPKN
jgi:hypothetical protein